MALDELVLYKRRYEVLRARNFLMTACNSTDKVHAFSHHPNRDVSTPRKERLSAAGASESGNQQDEADSAEHGPMDLAGGDLQTRKRRDASAIESRTLGFLGAHRRAPGGGLGGIGLGGQGGHRSLETRGNAADVGAADAGDIGAAFAAGATAETHDETLATLDPVQVALLKLCARSIPLVVRRVWY